MNISPFSSYDRSGSPISLVGAWPTGPPGPPGVGAGGPVATTETDAPVGPPEAISTEPIDVRPRENPGALGHPAVRQDFATLVDAVNQGNVGGALSALEAIQQHAPGTYDRGGRLTNEGQPFRNELDQLMRALKHGDDAEAKSALARLQKEMTAAHERRQAEDNPVAGGITMLGRKDPAGESDDSDRASLTDRVLRTDD